MLWTSLLLPLTLLSCGVASIEPEDFLYYQMPNKGEPPAPSKSPIVMLAKPNVTVLGLDPLTTHRLNANSFQQHALTSFKGWQYAVFYTSDTQHHGAPRYVNVARRLSGAPEWETVGLRDYEQTTDDGHNTISLGICEGDGTLHLSFDLHCDGLRYRMSKPGVATKPESVVWEAGLFGDVLGHLPGTEEDKMVAGVLEEVTYPRFLTVEKGDLVLEMRTGKAGAGSDVLFKYNGEEGEWGYLGRYLVGKGCSPYVNGLSLSPWGTMFVSWTNRMYVEYEDETGEIHKQQAGPNGPENNVDLGFAMSNDGRKWRQGRGPVFTEKKIEERLRRAIAGEAMEEEELLADLGADKENGIDATEEYAIAQKIPRNSGVLNQEGQCAGGQDDFHVLMRDRLDSEGGIGENRWKHYRRVGISGRWFVDSIDVEGLRPTDTGRRGKVVCARQSTLFFVLPGNEDETLSIVQRRVKWDGIVNYGPFEVVWMGEGYDGEPLVDEAALDKENRLSIMTRTSGEEKTVVVLDFQLRQEDLEWDMTATPRANADARNPYIG